MSAPHSVLIVEDDEAMRRGLCDNFAKASYIVHSAADGESGLERGLELRPDLFVVDVMLPLINGFDLCRELRREEIVSPLIFLTAKADEPDILLGLGLGGDDYVTKPFSIRQLLARCAAHLRRVGSGGAQEIPVGDFQLDLAARELRDAAGEAVELSPREYDLLAYMAQHRGRALTREQIMSAVWGHGCLVTLRSVDRFVTTLRKKIERVPQHPRILLTVREYGYRMPPQ